MPWTLVLLASCGRPDAEDASVTLDARPWMLTRNLDQATLKGLPGQLGVTASTLTVRNGAGVFEPSTALKGILDLAAGKVEDRNQTFNIPVVSRDPPGIVPTITATVERLDYNGDLEAVVEQYDYVLKASFNGNIHLHMPSPWPDSDIALTKVEAEARIRFYGGIKLLALDVRISKEVQNCGIFDWCNGLVAANIPNDIEANVQGQMRAAMEGLLNKPETQKAFEDALLAFAKVGGVADEAGATPWKLQPSSIRQYDWKLEYQLSRTVMPDVGPTNCRSSINCMGNVSLICDASGGTKSLHRVIDGVDATVTTGDSAWLTDEYSQVGGSAEYYMCVGNAAGQLCGARVPVTYPATQQFCSGGGGGGGPSKLCTKRPDGTLECKKPPM